MNMRSLITLQAQVKSTLRNSPTARLTPSAASADGVNQHNSRFYDNRQKYLLFVNTCSEKWIIAERVTKEFANFRPRPPAVRLFDTGLADGTVLARVMRAMQRRFPTFPPYAVGKEISLDDMRLEPVLADRRDAGRAPRGRWALVLGRILRDLAPPTFTRNALTNMLSCDRISEIYRNIGAGGDHPKQTHCDVPTRIQK
jgi:hypothetical protein